MWANYQKATNIRRKTKMTKTEFKKQHNDLVDIIAFKKQALDLALQFERNEISKNEYVEGKKRIQAAFPKVRVCVGGPSDALENEWKNYQKNLEKLIAENEPEDPSITKTKKSLTIIRHQLKSAEDLLKAMQLFKDRDVDLEGIAGKDFCIWGANTHLISGWNFKELFRLLETSIGIRKGGIKQLEFELKATSDRLEREKNAKTIIYKASYTHFPYMDSKELKKVELSGEFETEEKAIAALEEEKKFHLSYDCSFTPYVAAVKKVNI
jgi:hypothetical protein